MYNFLYYKDDEGIRTPWFIENSKLPIILSYLAPIDIWAIAFGPFVWCRGEMDAETKNHETIHYHQQLELLFIGQWILYVFYWLKGLITYRNGEIAYLESPFEREAYANDQNLDYLKTRKPFAWSDYRGTNNQAT
tara:strand:- start:794 stop:1198 length:405 start_codon:yes stop_codon:yes gene_type:complete